MIINLGQFPINIWGILWYKLRKSLCVSNCVVGNRSSCSISCKSNTWCVNYWLRCNWCLRSTKTSNINSICWINFYPWKILLIWIFRNCNCLSTIGSGNYYICSNNSYCIYSTSCSLNWTSSLYGSSLIIVICVICANCNCSRINSWFRISSQWC